MKSGSESTAMNPNPDPLESRLSQVPLRPAPSHLRRRILDSAPAVRRPAPDRIPWHLRLSWSWAALAAVWAFAVLGTTADRWLNGGAVRAPAVTAEQRVLAQRFRAEAFGVAGLAPAPRGVDGQHPPSVSPPVSPVPRSDRRRVPTGFIPHSIDTFA